MKQVRTRLRTLVGVLVTTASAAVAAQSLDPGALYRPLADNWPTYSGDYSGKRYSALEQINRSNVKNLGLVWVARISPGLPSTGVAGGFGSGAAAVPTIVGGYGTGELNQSAGRSARIVGSVLAVDGTLYVSTLDNAWAVDARDGRLLWHYVWKTLGGTHTGNRGLGMWRDRLFMTTPDNYLVSLDAATGKERWNKKIAELSQQYFRRRRRLSSTTTCSSARGTISTRRDS